MQGINWRQEPVGQHQQEVVAMKLASGLHRADEEAGKSLSRLHKRKNATPALVDSPRLWPVRLACLWRGS